MLALEPATVLALAPTILLRSLPEQDCYFAFDVASGDQFRLNLTAFWILEAIGAGTTWADLKARFSEAFEIGPKEAEADLLAVVSQLHEEDVIRRVSREEETQQATL